MKGRMYNLDLAETTVKLCLQQCGEEHITEHTVRNPTMQEWLEYDQNSAKIKDGEVTQTILEARVDLYNKIIQRIEGYCDSKESNPVSLIAKIPPIHKSLVIATAFKVEVDKDKRKN